MGGKNMFLNVMCNKEAPWSLGQSRSVRIWRLSQLRYCGCKELLTSRWPWRWRL